MTTPEQGSLFKKVDAMEYNICVYFNNFSRKRNTRRFFRIISRLGDGVFWYALMLTVAFLFGFKGYAVSIGMVIMAVINVAIYKSLKHRLVRERPYISFQSLSCGTPPLDRYSFPSGHTLHAVSFTAVCVFFFPLFSILLIPMALLIAASRIILGLHYPTDVVMGALIGMVVSLSTIHVISAFV